MSATTTVNKDSDKKQIETNKSAQSEWQRKIIREKELEAQRKTQYLQQQEQSINNNEADNLLINNLSSSFYSRS